MRGSRITQGLLFASLLFVFFVQTALAGDLKIPLPSRSQVTPVQRLNREGVEAVRRHQYQKAKNLFYRAYLYDPDDPFTLNNLAFVSEVEGQVDRSLEFYQLASRQSTNAIIDQASSRDLKGRPFQYALNGNEISQNNRANIRAVQLLSRDRPFEAEKLLRDALKSDPHDAFTLNNLGVAKEAEGDLEAAVNYYQEAERSDSNQPAILTLNRKARNRSVSQIAADNLKRARGRVEDETAEQHAARLSFQGVAALNRNDWRVADEKFRAAYALDPYSAFTLNNLGYVAEMGGDPETAEFFYQRARRAPGADARVGLATRQLAKGAKLAQVSGENDQKVTSRLAQEDRARRSESSPVELKHRDNSPVIEPAGPAVTPPGLQPSSTPAPPAQPNSPPGFQPPNL